LVIAAELIVGSVVEIVSAPNALIEKVEPLIDFFFLFIKIFLDVYLQTVTSFSSGTIYVTNY